MSNLFYRASAFNQPIAEWNTAGVADMSCMFYRASAFNQPIAAWNTAGVGDMSRRVEYFRSRTYEFQARI